MKTILILSVAVGGAIGSVARYLVAIGSARAFGLAGCILSDRAWRERGRGALYDRLGGSLRGRADRDDASRPRGELVKSVAFGLVASSS